MNELPTPPVTTQIVSSLAVAVAGACPSASSVLPAWEQHVALETSGKLGACIGKCAKLGPLERGVDEDGLGSPVQRVDEAGCKGGA